jgi:hypothetical protein
VDVTIEAHSLGWIHGILILFCGLYHCGGRWECGVSVGKLGFIAFFDWRKMKSLHAS